MWQSIISFLFDTSMRAAAVTLLLSKCDFILSLILIFQRTNVNVERRDYQTS